MKGSRAKKAAEATTPAAGGQAPADLTPAAPKEPRSGPPRPGPIAVAAGFVQIPEEVFRNLCSSIRTNTLLGAAAADALEEAAGLRSATSPQSNKAKELRSEVADSRAEDAPKPKKKVGGFADQVDEIPDIEEKVVTKGRFSFVENQIDMHQAETVEEPVDKDASEPPELNLTPKQNDLRTKLEMWVMDDIPELFGVDDSEELDEALQEDGQAEKITQLISETKPEAQKTLLNLWLFEAPDAEKKAAFTNRMLEGVAKIQDLGPKKKKKKQKG